MSNPLGLPDEMLHVYDRPVCVVTGGTSGIGLATAQTFARRGYNLIICGRSQDRLNEATKKILDSTEALVCLTKVCDLSVPGQAQVFAEFAVDQLKRVDVLVNNAGLAPLAMLEDVTDKMFEDLLEVNVRTNFYLTREIWRTMKEQGRGVVVNVSSLSAIDPFPGFSLYGASKAWADLMTTALAAEGEECGIRVYSVRPGAVETPLLRGLFPDFPAEQCVSPQEVADKILSCVEQPDDHLSGSHYPVTNQPI